MNYYLTGINNVLNQAVEDKVINANPITAKSVWQKLKKVERPLFTYEEKERLVSAAIKTLPPERVGRSSGLSHHRTYPPQGWRQWGEKEGR